MQHLEGFLRVFTRDQIMILDFNTLLKKTAVAVAGIRNFFGLTGGGWDENTTLPHENAGGVSVVIDCDTLAALEAYYAPHNARLYQLLQAAGAPPSEPPFQRFVTSVKCASEEVISVL